MASNKNVTSVSFFFFLLFLFTTVNSTTVVPSWHAAGQQCPIDTRQLAACAPVLATGPKGKPQQPCCHFLAPLVKIDALLCVCIALKDNVLGSNLDIPLSVRIILKNCRQWISLPCPDDI
ncbi:hypothetical protein HN51_002880 [Arachis hypogaea]|uniref:Hydrophobic seed protein domain-containing protein n=1 Tax=Arachis hypogaea TaxID=3818 RepID=A0A445EKT1_ARAHY|nr:Cortical cell-delineating protein [Arachis hypogaea]RYR76069.1 hypothetical protein Ahy_A01g000661 [Arachis hypogaea]